MLSIAVSSLAQLSLYISLTLYYTESKRRDARAQRFAKSRLEGAMDEFWGFEPTLFINIELRKCASKFR
jgi:lipoprotein NlpI